MRQRNNAFFTEDIIGGKVSNIAGNLLIRNTLEDITGNNEVCSGEVQDANTVLHLGKALAVDNALGIGSERYMNGNEITGGIDFVQCGNVLYLVRDHQRMVNGKIRVIADNIHAQCNSGIRYYHGGGAQVPLTFKGPYESNPCSYRLEPLSTLWEHRNGPYGEGHIFSSYGAFAGDNYRKNAANPAWAWRNKTQFGFGGSFLSDPAWTFSRAVDGFSFSSDYLLNPYADWKVTIHAASAGKKITVT